jgi:hypothetical protein
LVYTKSNRKQKTPLFKWAPQWPDPLRPSKPAHADAGTRARSHRVNTHGARGMASLLRGHRRPRCTGETTPSTSTSSRTRQAPKRRWGAHGVMGHRERLWAHCQRGRFRHSMTSRAFGSVEKQPERWDVATSSRDWKTAQGARLSPVKGVGASRAEQRRGGSSELLPVFLCKEEG